MHAACTTTTTIYRVNVCYIVQNYESLAQPLDLSIQLKRLVRHLHARSVDVLVAQGLYLGLARHWSRALLQLVWTIDLWSCLRRWSRDRYNLTHSTCIQSVEYADQCHKNIYTRVRLKVIASLERLSSGDRGIVPYKFLCARWIRSFSWGKSAVSVHGASNLCMLYPCRLKGTCLGFVLHWGRFQALSHI